jgi:hypothetical protein
VVRGGFCLIEGIMVEFSWGCGVATEGIREGNPAARDSNPVNPPTPRGGNPPIFIPIPILTVGSKDGFEM